MLSLEVCDIIADYVDDLDILNFLICSSLTSQVCDGNFWKRRARMRTLPFQRNCDMYLKTLHKNTNVYVPGMEKFSGTQECVNRIVDAGDIDFLQRCPRQFLHTGFWTLVADTAAIKGHLEFLQAAIEKITLDYDGIAWLVEKTSNNGYESLVKYLLEKFTHLLETDPQRYSRLLTGITGNGIKYAKNGMLSLALERGFRVENAIIFYAVRTANLEGSKILLDAYERQQSREMLECVVKSVLHIIFESVAYADIIAENPEKYADFRRYLQSKIEEN